MNIKNKFFLFSFLSVIWIAVVYGYTIIFPSVLPSSVTVGPEIGKVLSNISQSCGAGKYLQGLTQTGSLICKNISSLPSLTLGTVQNHYTASGNGIYRKYFNNILNDCGNGRYLKGFNSDKKMICVDKNGAETFVGLDLDPLPVPEISVVKPTTSLGTPPYTTYLTNILSQSCGPNEAITGFDANGVKLGCTILMQDGLCGSAHTTINTTPPTTNLCSAGTPSTVSGSGPWTWTCNGVGGGANASCSVCPQHYYYNGTSCVGIRSYIIGSPDHYTMCKKCGTTLVGGWRNCFADGTCRNGPAIVNKCISVYDTPAMETCNPSTVNGTCGTANGTNVSTAPTTNLCSTGTPTTVTGSGPWTWTCNGSGGGTNANCSTVESNNCILDATLDCILY